MGGEVSELQRLLKTSKQNSMKRGGLSAPKIVKKSKHGFLKFQNFEFKWDLQMQTTKGDVVCKYKSFSTKSSKNSFRTLYSNLSCLHHGKHLLDQHPTKETADQDWQTCQWTTLWRPERPWCSGSCTLQVKSSASTGCRNKNVQEYASVTIGSQYWKEEFQWTSVRNIGQSS